MYPTFKLSSLGWMKSVLILLFALSVINIHAQEFSIKKLELDGEKINIYYDLIDTTVNHTYTINLYSSLDNFTAPMLKVAGAIGLEIRPGLNQKIVWSAKEEIGPFEGRVALEVRGKLYVPFVRLIGFADQRVRKRGVKFDVIWSGGRASSLLNFELYRNGKFVAAPQTNIAASLGKTEITIPKSVKIGKDYQFKIVDSKNKEDMVFTNHFRIKARFPILLKIGILGGIGAGAYLLTSGSEPEEIVDPLIPSKGN